MGEDCLRRVLGEHTALAEDRDAVAEHDRLVDVVRDEDDRLAQLALDPQELVLEPGARDRVDRAERLVHEHDRRVRRERACETDALALAARELRGKPLASTAGRSTRSRSSSTRRAVSPFGRPRSRGTVATLSATVMCGKSPTCWMT